MSSTTQRLKTTNISTETFESILARYPSTVPDKLRDLDTLRYDTIPTAVASRANDGAYLTKDEVEKLVEWKLKHGTFRPKLLQLVQSNPAKDIESTTKDAFSNTSNTLVSLKTLTKLKGIGPATASLLLSVSNPTLHPFFSDELFRWTAWEEPGKPGGWNRVIKYTVKEYQQLLRQVEAMRARIGVSAVDVERVAWVLGREGVDIGAGDSIGEARSGKEEGGETKDSGKDVSTVEAKKDVSTTQGKKTQQKKTAKRKTVEVEPSAEGLRRSNRRKVAP